MVEKQYTVIGHYYSGENLQVDAFANESFDSLNDAKEFAESNLTDYCIYFQKLLVEKIKEK